MPLAPGCISCPPSGDSTHGIEGHQNPSTSPGSSGRQLDETSREQCPTKENLVPCRKPWTECSLQPSKGESGMRYVGLELCAPTLCPIEGHPKRVQERNRMERRWPWSLLVPANPGWPICRDEYELEVAADPRGCDLDERAVIPYHASHRTESQSKHQHAIILYYFILYLNYFFPIISKCFKGGLCPFCGLSHFLVNNLDSRQGSCWQPSAISMRLSSIFFLFCCLFVPLVLIKNLKCTIQVNLDAFQILNFQVLYSVSKASHFLGKLKVLCHPTPSNSCSWVQK